MSHQHPKQYLQQGPVLIVTALGAALLAVALFHSTAYAATCGGTETSVISCDDQVQGDTQVSGIWSLLLIAINILTAGVGVFAVGGLVYAAIMYTTAEDKADQINKAKAIITNTVIGLISFALMYSGLQYLVPGGVFNSISAPRVSISKQNDLNPGLDDSTDIPAGSTNSTSPGGGSDSPSGTTTKLAGVGNFRDVGISTGILKTGVVYRSASLAGAKSSAITKLSDLLKGGVIIDTRSAAEQSDRPDKSIPGVTHRSASMPGTLAYTKFVTESVYRTGFKNTLTMVANNQPVLIHCAAGKDRTGWAIAMIMHIAGASRKQIMTEYMRSASYGAVKEEWMNAGLDKAIRNYGSINKYLKNGLGLSDSTIAKIRNKVKA